MILLRDLAEPFARIVQGTGHACLPRAPRRLHEQLAVRRDSSLAFVASP